MPRAVALNVGANTNEPGFRAPIYPDGRFTFVPIPESQPTTSPPPTYEDLGLDLPFALPEAVADRPVHLDPEFAEYPFGDNYTYGDPWGVKARPLLDLSAGDYLFFYATLSTPEDRPAWAPPKWGAFLVGQFRLAREPVTGEAYESLDADERAVFDSNAHVKREDFDARVLVLGDPDASRLYDRAVPLSEPSGGTDANWLVTDCSSDSGKGPWWRRPLRFDEAATDRLLEAVDSGPVIDPSK